MIPKEAIEAAIQAYMKETDSEPHHLKGWFEPALTAALTAAFAAMSEPVAWAYEWKPWNINNDWQDDVSIVDPRLKRVREYRNVRPLYAAPQPAAVKVKLLEWRTLDNGDAWSKMTPVGLMYHATQYGWMHRNGNLNETPGIEAAKSAAQADYEKRILSALEGGGE